MNPSGRKLWSILLWASSLLLVTNETASAARLLDVYVELDGNVIVHTFYSDGGRADAATVWRYLQNRPIMVNDEVTSLPGDEVDPLIATLEGNLVLKVQHTSRVIARADLSSLTLRRESEQTQLWFLSTTEVERTAAIAGLGSPGSPPMDPLVNVMLAVPAIAVMALVGIAAVVLLLRRNEAVRMRES